MVSANGMPKDIVPEGNRWNFGSGACLTHKGWQYAAYWDDAKQVSVARRKLPQGAWEVASLGGYQRTATGNRGKGGASSRGFGDGHEKVSMGISPDGCIHLSFDHHLSELRYRVSKAPVAAVPEKHEWSDALFGPVQNNLGGERIESVTYPAFSTDGKNFVLYLRLGGGSGSANSHFFNYQNGKWVLNGEKESKVIDKKWSGRDKTVNAYVHGLVFHGARRHMTWCWRDTPDAKTSHDLCYAYSDDGGKTWKNNNGVEIGRTGKEFITADSPGVAVVKIPAGSGYVNGGSVAISGDGVIHVLCRGKDGSPTHFKRNPATGKWTVRRTTGLGELVVTPGGLAFGVSDRGVWPLEPLKGFGPVVLGADERGLFADCRPALDSDRLAHDGWVSLIGQKGREITVIDFKLPQE
jgi:ribosomal protein L24E